MKLAVPLNDRFMRLIDEIKREEYERGWNDAVKSLVAAARKGIPAPDHRPNAVPTPPMQDDGTSVIDMVQSVIQDRPGLRGAQIVRFVVAKVPGSDRKAMDRTCRTALSRLKKRGRIEQRKKRWYLKKEAKKEAPAVGSLAP